MVHPARLSFCLSILLSFSVLTVLVFGLAAQTPSVLVEKISAYSEAEKAGVEESGQRIIFQFANKRTVSRHL